MQVSTLNPNYITRTITQVASIEEARNHPTSMGLDYTVNQLEAAAFTGNTRELFDSNGQSVFIPETIAAPSFSAIEAQGVVYNMPSARYGLIQPNEWFHQALDMLESTGAKILSISMRNFGPRMYMDVEVSAVEMSRADQKIGDIVKFGIRISDSFNSSMNFRLALYALRLWCLNGCTHELASIKASVRHSAKVDISSCLNLTKDRIEELPQVAASYQDFASAEVSPRERGLLLDSILEIDDETPAQKLNVREEIENLSIRGTGNSGATMFDVFNGVTEYENHFRSTRKTNNAVEVEASRFLQANSAKSLSVRAYDVLKESLRVGAFTIDI